MLRRWRAWPVWLRLISIPVSFSPLVLLGVAAGRMLDCSPGQQDGQCGLATFLGMVWGVVVAIGFSLIAWVGIGVEWFQARRRPSPRE